eukprot:CAMPEP_0174250800 /NCGR_PEP_ID=MMETSP0439-20130205/847_1 /TAXON_ID=0 /ORGANISM="Stereomyxa ramosa, Strain Chinc5" /LENGTH=212 /DNA_ID=CAMNT_0015330963 /DNA_START=76 /DNA_END=714 /DNA_ORIENTATION=+
MNKVIVVMLMGLLWGSNIDVTDATLGVDVSQLTTVFGCLKQSGYEFAIIRGFRSSGSVDPYVVKNIENARAAGIPYVDVYLFPCVSCGNPGTQSAELLSAISGQNYGMVWVDIEVYAWTSSKTTNQRFITEMVGNLTSRGAKVGIYTSYYNWESIVGLDWTGVSRYPLWYAHYDNSPSFGDFKAFGGWSKPSIKQYAGDKTVCGAGVDLNYY